MLALLSQHLPGPDLSFMPEVERSRSQARSFVKAMQKDTPPAFADHTSRSMDNLRILCSSDAEQIQLSLYTPDISNMQSYMGSLLRSNPCSLAFLDT